MVTDNMYYTVAGLVVGFLMGILGGYYLGIAESEQRAAEVVPVTLAPRAGASGVNTLGDVETNPYEGVKLNPFE